MVPVHLFYVKQGTKIWADETGWQVKGKLWWLWIFANERSADHFGGTPGSSPAPLRCAGEEPGEHLGQRQTAAIEATSAA